MNDQRPAFSLIISTLGRHDEIVLLLDSLEQQRFSDFEVIIIDQNADDRVAKAMNGHVWQFPINHVQVPEMRGISRGRNSGWRISNGQYVSFPDDDCWYPPWLLERAYEKIKLTRADVVTGRAADMEGCSINGRFEETAQEINKANVWTTSIEWMIFFKRSVLENLNGFDEALGVGSGKPWGSGEGQDILLRALSAGFRCEYFPDVYGHHPELDIRTPNAAMLAKARSYGRGMGYVVGRHKFGIRRAAYWTLRPLLGAVYYGLRFNFPRVRYYWNVAIGRLEGWLKSG